MPLPRNASDSARTVNGSANANWIHAGDAICRRPHRERGVEIVVEQRGAVCRTGVRGDGGSQRRDVALVGRRAIRDHRVVAVERRIRRGIPTAREVPDRAVVDRRMREHHRHAPRTLHDGVAPHELLHRLRRLHPRAAGEAPARRAEDVHLEAEPVSFRRGVAHGVEPLRRAEDDLPLDRLSAASVHVGELEPRDADALHPLEILGDPFLGDVALRPVPPGARPRACRRIPEADLERVAGALRRGDAERSDDERERRERREREACGAHGEGQRVAGVSVATAERAVPFGGSCMMILAPGPGRFQAEAAKNCNGNRLTRRSRRELRERGELLSGSSCSRRRSAPLHPQPQKRRLWGRHPACIAPRPCSVLPPFLRVLRANLLLL